MRLAQDSKKEYQVLQARSGALYKAAIERAKAEADNEQEQEK